MRWTRKNVCLWLSDFFTWLVTGMKITEKGRYDK